MLLLALIYAAYHILRQSVVEPTQRAVVCAVTSIFGMVDIPIVYMANQWWRTQHPAPVLSGEGSIDPTMRFVLYFSFFALLSVFWLLVRVRRRVEDLRREVDGLRREVHSL
jgi:heme exporter protein C